jgi:hypothetical protein
MGGGGGWVRPRDFLAVLNKIMSCPCWKNSFSLVRQSAVTIFVWESLLAFCLKVSLAKHKEIMCKQPHIAVKLTPRRRWTMKLMSPDFSRVEMRAKWNTSTCIYLGYDYRSPDHSVQVCSPGYRKSAQRLRQDTVIDHPVLVVGYLGATQQRKFTSKNDISLLR